MYTPLYIYIIKTIVVFMTLSQLQLLYINGLNKRNFNTSSTSAPGGVLVVAFLNTGDKKETTKKH